MRSYFRRSIVFLAFFLGLSCEDKKKETTVTTNNLEATEVIQEKLPKLVVLVGKAKENVEQWTEFTDFDIEMQRIYEKEIDLETLFIELLRKEVELRDSNFPEKFEVSAVKSRLLVLRTYLGRAKAALEENNPDVIHKEKIAILNAYNAFRIQLMDVWKKNIAEEFLKNDSI
ncbi:hypothetical protein [Ascidiimonas sp. W6]|uniref:hypothetical protein n=1 Tax=Ascidiimonas meishanensis TaxID=3128903 RepID=UPI0030EF0A28